MIVADRSDSKLKQNYSCRFGNSSSLCKEAFITSSSGKCIVIIHEENTSYNLFSCRCLSPLLGIYDINIFYSVFFHYLCLLRCGQVNEWTSRRVNKLLEKKTKELWKVDKWTSRRVNKLLAAINTANSSNHNYELWTLNSKLSKLWSYQN